MTEHFTKAKQLLEQASSILLTTHERTDGDDLGTVLALAHHLRAQGKRVAIVITRGVPPQLSFLPMTEQVSEDLPHTQFDLLVISGCSNRQRVNHEGILGLKIPTLNLDHHVDNAMYGDVNVVDSSKSSVAELTYDLFKFAGWEITHEVALCLLTGIVTDTGVFMHSSTSASTLAAAADLVGKGARVATVTKHTYQGKDLASLKAWGKALENMQYDPHQQMIYSILTEDELNILGDPPIDAFDGFVETLNKVPEAKFAMFLKQDKGHIRGSLRSEEYKGTNVAAIAQSLGGGGHKLAAGFSLVGRLAKNAQGKWEVV
jgi:bifunctional oligoribonuclease and PAP phosphatase NrnA